MSSRMLPFAFVAAPPFAPALASALDLSHCDESFNLSLFEVIDVHSITVELTHKRVDRLRVVIIDCLLDCWVGFRVGR